MSAALEPHQRPPIWIDCALHVYRCHECGREPCPRMSSLISALNHEERKAEELTP